MPRQPDIRVIDVLRDIWDARKFIMIGLVAGLVVAGGFLALAHPQYKARMIVAPANPMNGAEMSSLMADDDLFALRYLIQRVGVSKSSDFVTFENTYFGPSVAQQLLQDDMIVKGLALDTSFAFSTPQKVWSVAQLSEYLVKRVKLSSSGQGGMREISYYHGNPDFAVYLLQQIHEVTDRQIREKIRAQASERIQYLNDAIYKTNNAEHRRNLTTLLLEQERLLMLVSIDQPYAAAEIEAPSASATALWPDVKLVLSMLGVLGAFFGFIVYSIMHVPALAVSNAGQTAPRRRLNAWYKDEPSNTDGQRPPSHQNAAE